MVFADLSTLALIAAIAISGFAGFVKGAVGFAMPLIMMSAFSSFLSPDLALAGLILPTIATNLSQAFRDGWAAAVGTARRYHRFLIATLICLVLSAQSVKFIPTTAFLLALGIPVTIFALVQLFGVPLKLRLEHQNRSEWVLGIIGGLYGGISGIWGPPLLIFLLSVGALKQETLRAQGVIFLLGAVILFMTHLQTGILNPPNTVFSALLVVPALLGQFLGQKLQDRMDQERFRRWTQILLVLTGANLIRQALMG